VSRVTLALAAVLANFFSFLPAFAQEQMPTPSFPVPWQLGLQHPVTPVAEQLVQFHTFLFWVITAISLFVLILLLICIFRFNEKANPVPAKWSHNTMLEIIWTTVPVLILLGIVLPIPGLSPGSFRLLYFMDRTAEAEMTLKITGNQWFWSYEYPDTEVSFDALSIPEDDIDVAKGQHRLLETDNHVVLPVDTNIRILFTANDVIHAWTIPAFGVKLDNMPGRINETWTRVTQQGRYYGQCSELCGVDHSFMPIVVDVVSKEEYQKWVEAKKQAKAAPAATSINLAAR
jgi:cytochrome c oxidase subunit 2